MWKSVCKKVYAKQMYVKQMYVKKEQTSWDLNRSNLNETEFSLRKVEDFLGYRKTVFSLLILFWY